MNRSRSVVFALLACALTAAPAAAATLTNQLRQHPSPYLALHGSDPVVWQDWNADTVAHARKSGKLLLVSSGYFTCHWCHVMQRESFKNPEIARYLNTHFIPVKVDRELQPALDARLIAFSEQTRGHSGWPLNVFVTPDGHPLYATLYHPPQEFLQVVQRVEQLWRTDRARLTELARTEAVTSTGPGKPVADAKQAQRLADKVLSESLRLADTLQGGFGEQRKFPQAPQMMFLLAHYERTRDPEVREFLNLTLDAMAHNGLYDQLGGGFFRYTVDPSWKTPHFEKMLYDNAQLARLYLLAAGILKNDEYRAVAIRTLEFMLREMRATSGAFIAALSALDDQDVEGGYYLWSRAELDSLLTPGERDVYIPYAGLSDPPQFEHGYFPLRAGSVDELAGQLKLEPAEVRRLIGSAEKKLLAARSQRGLPRDTKELAAWNGLALTALVEAARATGEPRFREAASAVRNYLATTLWDGKDLVRARAGGKPSGKVALEDYAYVTAGLTDWAALTGAAADYALARQVALAGWQRFYGPRGWSLEQNSLLAAEPGQDVISDSSLPSPSGVMIDASLRIAEQARDTALRNTALGALNSGATLIEATPFLYATPVDVRLRAAGSVPK